MNQSQKVRNPKLSFVVPCYNEAQNIERTVRNVQLAMKLSAMTYEVVIVDDCSADDTFRIASEIAEKSPEVRAIRHSVNSGLGGAYKTGRDQAYGSYLMLVPGDDGFDRANIERVVAFIGRADIVIPYVTNSWSRGVARGSLHYLFTLLLNILFLMRVRYYNGPVVHRLDLLRSIEIGTNGFAYQAEALVKLISAGATYIHVPIEVQDRMTGASTALSRKNRQRVYKTIYRLLNEIGLFRVLKFPEWDLCQEVRQP